MLDTTEADTLVSAGLGLSTAAHHTASLLLNSERASRGGTCRRGAPKLDKRHKIVAHVYALQNLPLVNWRTFDGVDRR